MTAYWNKDRVLFVSGNMCVKKERTEFIAAVKKTHGDNEHGKAYMKFVKQVDDLRM